MSATTDLPAPLVPPNTDITGLPGFLLDVEKLFASELWALSTPEEFKAAVALWGRAWQQTPPGSLPNDERILSRFSGAGSRWKKVRAMALRGFVLCSDGKWYHKTLAADVLRAAESKRQRKARTAAASAAKTKPTDGDPGPDKPTKSMNGHDRYDDRYGDRHDPRNGDRDGVTRQTVTTLVTTSHRSNREEEEEDKAQAYHPEHRAADAGPGRAEVWNSRANFDRVEARCRADLPNGGPQDLRISPMAKLEHEGYDLEAEIIPALLDAQAASRTPIRTWGVFADRCRERIDAQRQSRAAQGLAAKPTEPTPDAEMVDMAPHGRWPEPIIRNLLARHRDHPGSWIEAVFGPPPGQPGCKIPARLLVGQAA